MKDFKIIKIGVLKYDRLKSMSVFKSELRSFGYDYGFFELKELFDKLLSNTFDEIIDGKFSHCVDKVFLNTEYEEIDIEDDDWTEERNFPEDYIPAFACSGSTYVFNI